MAIIRLRLARRAVFADGALVTAFNVFGSVIASMAGLLFVFAARVPALRLAVVVRQECIYT